MEIKNINMYAFDYFNQLHKTPPFQGKVGHAPEKYFSNFNVSSTLLDYINKKGYDIRRKLDRIEVSLLCSDNNIDDITAYSLVMAWGGRNPRNFRYSIEDKNLKILLKELRGSNDSIESDFQKCKTIKVKGLGISFYTKVLYFFRSQPDSYILDQWIVKSLKVLLTNNSPVRMLYQLPHPETTAEEYSNYCSLLNLLAEIKGDWSGEQVEAALFDAPKGAWRNFVKNKLNGK